jgi:hypothetical protein
VGAVKLADLTPETVALDVARASHDHVVDLTMRLLAPSCEGPWLPRGQDIDASLRSTQIYLTVLDLAAYAIRGEPLDAPVQEYLISLIPLYSTAVGADVDVDGLASDADPQTPLGLVIAAALARSELAAKRPLTTAQLAVLGGVSEAYVRRLVTSGELGRARGGGSGPGQGHRVSARDAERWLRSRATAG